MFGITVCLGVLSCDHFGSNALESWGHLLRFLDPYVPIYRGLSYVAPGEKGFSHLMSPGLLILLPPAHAPSCEGKTPRLMATMPKTKQMD